MRAAGPLGRAQEAGRSPKQGLGGGTGLTQDGILSDDEKAQARIGEIEKSGRQQRVRRCRREEKIQARRKGKRRTEGSCEACDT